MLLGEGNMKRRKRKIKTLEIEKNGIFSLTK